jgi:hypothetical protein
VFDDVQTIYNAGGNVVRGRALVCSTGDRAWQTGTVDAAAYTATIERVDGTNRTVVARGKITNEYANIKAGFGSVKLTPASFQVSEPEYAQVVAAPVMLGWPAGQPDPSVPGQSGVLVAGVDPHAPPYWGGGPPDFSLLAIYSPTPADSGHQFVCGVSGTAPNSVGGGSTGESAVGTWQPAKSCDYTGPKILGPPTEPAWKLIGLEGPLDSSGVIIGGTYPPSCLRRSGPGSTSAPPPPAPPPSAPIPVVGGAITPVIACTASHPCSGTATLTAALTTGRRVAADRASRPAVAQKVIAHAHWRAAAHHTTELRLVLTAAGRNALKHHARLPATLTVRTHGARTPTLQRLILKASS